MAYGLQVRGTDLYVNGAPLRHIGVNAFQLFMQEIGVPMGVSNPGLTAQLTAIKAAGFRFVRIGFGFYEYTDWRDRYYDNKANYWATVQRVLDAAHAAGLGVGVCMAWLPKQFSKLTYHVYGASEGMGNFGEPSSNLWALWSDYVTQFAQRFSSHPAVWWWGPSNEASGALGPEWFPGWKVDGTGTDQGGTPLPNPTFNWGSKPEGGSYAASDKMLRHQYQRWSQMTVDLIRANDPHARAITSGNGLGMSFGVRSAVNNSLGADSLAQWQGADGTTRFQPWVAYREQAYDTIGGHLYMRGAKAGDGQFWSDGDCPSYARMIQYHKEWADQARKPFMLEEFGASSRSSVDGVSTTGTELANFTAAVQAVVDNNIGVAAAWNWGGTLADGSLAMENAPPEYTGAGPEWAAWDLSHPSNAAKLAVLQSVNASRS